MSFDKNKAMRNAERFLAQGKIRAAINEYQRVVENDPRDFSTLNILGDLYAKNRDTRQAVGCFTQVAEHYNAQGFAHKAIAVYNKISRIEPKSIEVSAKLAELYQSKGSIAEARQHYKTLAEHYQQKGQKIEALAIWKQIAELDPNNTEIYLKIAETCSQEEQFDEAVRAFTEAGLRFIRHGKLESALTAFSRALEIKKDDLRALKGLVKAQIGLGCADEAANALEKVLKEQPNNRDILYLLVDCYLDMENAPQAERAVIKLVEQEPANYPKFLELVKLYLKSGNTDAATRVLSISSENLLGGGQAEDFHEWTNEILARNPEQIEALRLLVRFNNWQRDETALRQSLERLAEAARLNEAIEDEHYALSQLVLIAPHETARAARLQEINSIHGFEMPIAASGNGVVEADFENDVPRFQNIGASEYEIGGQGEDSTAFEFADVQGSYEFETNGSHQNVSGGDGSKEFEFYGAAIGDDDFEAYRIESPASADRIEDELSLADGLKLQKEFDSIEFYIEQGYLDLAAKSLDELEAEFGERVEIVNLRARLEGGLPTSGIEIETGETDFVETDYAFGNADTNESVEVPEQSSAPPVQSPKIFDNFDELKDELEAEEARTMANTDEDYEMHYHLATAYKEMGLMENAIREFQDAINLVEVNDGTRRFFQCANLLGHCFMEKQMPKLAAHWFMRDLEVADLTDEEKQAIYYELGNAFEATGEQEKAAGYFEQLYADNVDYRDVSRRLQNLQENNLPV
jgi:tetratricopeptide (TPR) repeat protein